MSFDILSFLATGLMPLPWWGYFVVALVLTHVTIASVTIYLHRSQAHRGLDLHPAVSHFFRFWLWLIALVGVIVPRRLRADWRQEWEAELRCREWLLADWDRLNWKTKLDLVRFIGRPS